MNVEVEWRSLIPIALAVGNHTIFWAKTFVHRNIVASVVISFTDGLWAT